MKKAIQTFIIWFLIRFLAIAATPLALSQPTSSPQSASLINQLEEAQIVFQHKTLFTIKNNLGLISLQKRQQKIEKRIAEFANNDAVSLDDLEVITMDEEGLPVSIIGAGTILISFVTEQDAKIAGRNRQELANEYYQKIRSAVKQYRQDSMRFMLHIFSKST